MYHKAVIFRGRSAVASVLMCLFALGGCASAPKEVVSDPFEGVNRKIYNFNRVIDRNIVKPIADKYVEYTPELIRISVFNFFQNLGEPSIFVNELLQGKIGDGVDDMVRFVVNSTVGLGGLFDPATALGLPKHEEDFGQTLATWGVGSGPYVVLPFLGPYTLRGTPDIAVSTLANPMFYVDDLAVTLPVGAVGVVDLRANAAGALQFIDDSAVDPYAFTRGAFLQRRNFLIHDGNPPLEDEEELFEELLEE